jgi:hypothetical protein
VVFERLKSRIRRKGHRNRSFSKREKQGNKTRSKVRARIVHVFGAQTNDMGGTLVRSIGIAHAAATMLKNLAITCAARSSSVGCPRPKARRETGGREEKCI